MTRGLLLLCASALALTACGASTTANTNNTASVGGSTPSPAGNAYAGGALDFTQACTVLTPSDVQAATGLTVSQSGANVGGTNFSAAAGAPGGVKYAVCGFEVNGGSVGFAVYSNFPTAYFGAFYTGMTSHGSAVSGIGDKASWDASSQTLIATKGDKLIVIGGSFGESGDADLAILKKLAEKVFSKF